MKEKNLIDLFLLYFWYYRCRFTFWLQGGKYFHISVGESSEPLWKAYQEFHRILNEPKQKTSNQTDYDIFGGKEEEDLRKFYQNKYSLSDSEIWDLHSSFSPRKVRSDLTYHEIKYYIARYKYRTNQSKKTLNQ